MSRCESRTGTGHRCANVPTIEDAARKALDVLIRNQYVWAMEDDHGEPHWVYCPECESPERFAHADGCALAEAISDLEKVL